MPSGSPQSLLPNGAGLSYRPFPRPQRLPPLRSLHSGVKGPDLLLRDLPARSPARSALGSPASTGLPQLTAASSPQARCGSSHPFARLLSLPPLPAPPVRLPTPPVSPSPPADFLFLVCPRINVPGSLRFGRLAVPQTSWNLLHY